MYERSRPPGAADVRRITDVICALIYRQLTGEDVVMSESYVGMPDKVM